MAGFTVEYLISLADKFSTPAAGMARASQTLTKAIAGMGAAANQAEGGIGRLGAGMSSASAGATGLARNANAARSAIASVGSAAQQSAASVSKLAQSQALLGRSGGPAARSVFLGRGGGGGVAGGMAAWFGVPAIFNAALDANKAENKFKALVDKVTPEQFGGIRGDLEARILKSGEKYADLMAAAGDAAQIVGNADIAGKIAVGASKLANIDTAGKDVSFFAENLAAVLGPNGSIEDLNRLSGMLAKAQKLGAATAGGTIEAYKNVVGFKGIYGFDEVEMITSLNMIKNVAPALQDSQIGNMAKYGVRTLAAPIPAFAKKLKESGLSSDSFKTDGNFDIGKTQALFHAMQQSPEGKKRFQELFAGRNVLAGQYWSMLAGIKPEDFRKYLGNVTDTKGVLDAADTQRFEGLVGAWNKLKSASWLLGRSIGEFLTPAFTHLTNMVAPLFSGVSSLLGWMQKSAPMLSSWAGLWLGVAGALGVIGTLWRPAAALASIMMRLPLGALAGLFGGLAAGGAGLSRQIALITRFAGALGLLRVALLGITRLTGLGAVFSLFDYLASHPKEVGEASEKLKSRSTNPMGPTADAIDRMFGWNTDPEKRSAAPSTGGGYVSGLAEAARNISEASRERMRVQFDPIKVEASSIAVEVHVEGDGIQGRGSGSAPLSATSPRGTTMAKPPADPVPR